MSFKKPKIPAAPPVMAPSFISGETGITGAGARMKRRMQAMFGRQSTILTGGGGVYSPTAPTKTLLGA
jgi:hypothetical protein